MARDRIVLAAASGMAALALAVTAQAQPKRSGESTDKPMDFPKVEVGIERCIPIVLRQHPGDVLQVVLKTERKEPVWEIEVAAKDGKLYDVECSGRSGKITETETRVKSADAPGFKEKVKVTEEKARELALAKQPGKIERVEYEIESGGAAVYEFDIKPSSGHDWRVEVDASTGEVKEAHPEWIEIGRP